MNGYTLTGTDMASWAGQRVQIMGTVVQPNPSVATGSGAPTLPQFRVQTVQPVSGPCPQR